jgi:hypothetical protein
MLSREAADDQESDEKEKEEGQEVPRWNQEAYTLEEKVEGGAANRIARSVLKKLSMGLEFGMKSCEADDWISAVVLCQQPVWPDK